MRSPSQVVSPALMFDPHVRIPPRRLLEIHAGWIADQTQRGYPSAECVIEELFGELQTPGERSHQRFADCDHSVVVTCYRIPPTGQLILRGKRRRLAQGITLTDNRRPVCNIGSHVNAFLAGQKSCLTRKPTAVHVRVRRVKLRSPQRPRLIIAQLENAQHFRARCTADGQIRGKILCAEKSCVGRRRRDGSVSSIAIRGRTVKQGGDVNQGYGADERSPPVPLAPRMRKSPCAPL